MRPHDRPTTNGAACFDERSVANPLVHCGSIGLLPVDRLHKEVRPGDLIPTDLCYADRTGEVYSLTWSPEHRWFYYPNQLADEALLLKCYDSDAQRARFTAHTAFEPAGPLADGPARESIEVRTLAFF